MAPLIVQLLVVLSLIPVVGYTVFSYQRSSEIVSLAQRNAARMEQVAYNVRAALRPAVMNGGVLAPLGDANGDRMALPSWVVSDDRSPWGARYGYCPYATTSAAPPATLNQTQATVGLGPAGGSYPVTVVQVRGKAYVAASPSQVVRVKDGTGAFAAPSNTVAEEVVGFIVSPPPFVGDADAPSCADVIKSNGAWIVSPGSSDGSRGKPGSVVPVLSRGVGTGQVANQGEVVLYTDASTVAGDTGDTPATALSLWDALDLWHLTPWKASTFLVAPGNYGFGPGDVVPGGSIPRLAFSTGLPGRAVAVAGSGGQAVLTNSGGGLTELLLTVDATLDNVSFGPGVQLRVTNGARVTVTNGNLRHVRVDGGDLTLGAGASVSFDPSANPSFPVVVTSGRLRIKDGAASGGSQLLKVTAGSGALAGIYASGGEIVMDGTGVDVESLPSGAKSVMVLEGARLSVAPNSNGSMPAVAVNGTIRGTLGAEMSVRAECTATATGDDGSCVASCRLPGESTSVRRSAMGGSCWADDAAPEQGESAARPEERPSLWRDGRGDLFQGYDAASWVCQWRPGQRFMQVQVGAATLSTFNGNANVPSRRAITRCVPDATVTAP